MGIVFRAAESQRRPRYRYAASVASSSRREVVSRVARRRNVSIHALADNLNVCRIRVQGQEKEASLASPVNKLLHGAT